MVPGKVVYTSVPNRFIKRVFQHLGYVWMPLVFILILFISLNSHEPFNILTISFFSLATVIIPLYDAYVKSIYHVRNITTLDNGFKFDVLCKDIPEVFEVSLSTINSKLRWLNYNRHTIELTIFDGESVLFKQYSNGSRESEYGLENIVFQMKEAINTK